MLIVAILGIFVNLAARGSRRPTESLKRGGQLQHILT